MLLPDDSSSDAAHEPMMRWHPWELVALLIGALALLGGGAWLSSAWSISWVGWLPLVVGGFVFLVAKSAAAPWRD